MKNYLKPFRNKKCLSAGIATVTSSVGLFLATTESVFASSTGDFKQTVQQTSDDFAADLKFYGTIIAGVAIFVIPVSSVIQSIDHPVSHPVILA